LFSAVHVVLVNPEIPPNTGNIIRLCANTGSTLHLVEPLGFTLDDKQLKRAGLDYHEFVSLTVHATASDLMAALDGRRLFTFSARSERNYSDVSYTDDDVLVFGTERSGLPDEIIASVPEDHRLTIPMRPDNRSLNLANTVAVVVYEAWRQRGFEGAAPSSTWLMSETLGADPVSD
jgi:tRNA (cytidine/uridine-2'-O-)-methyltransferase